MRKNQAQEADEKHWDDMVTAGKKMDKYEAKGVKFDRDV